VNFGTRAAEVNADRHFLIPGAPHREQAGVSHNRLHTLGRAYQDRIRRKIRVAAARRFGYPRPMADKASGWLRDYGRIERAIAFIEAHIDERPDLSALARAAGLSEFHFQRLFSRMVGISPKKYAQYLCKEAAKTLLAGSESVLDAALETGLSGPGRLHDLLVSCEAVTPGEYKSGGAGLAIDYGFHPSPFGEAMIALTARGICSLRFVADSGRAAALAKLSEEWPRAAISLAPARTRVIARAIFSSAPGANRPLSLYLRGTNFQVKVWEALLAVPTGRFATYEAIAARIGEPRAARAVGSAVGRNPVAFLIPCHRVIRKSGDLGGYRWGPGRKRLILAWESEKARRTG
jgi:AraC family transcriptional regulator of adaptative response/methylated-DNA-[protein]-cysteine methyltransferase